MKKMIALLVLAFFGMTATCGMTFAAEANNGMATANEQALQDPATPVSYTHLRAHETL